eukprot:151541-Heterocapsa_arctica.AAC.1
MRLAANAQAITQLAHSNKEQEAEMSSMHHDHRLIAQNLELHQARDVDMLKSELHATNASEIQTLESLATAERRELALAAKNEHDEQVRHAELKETRFVAETRNLAS